ncbi:MAG: hypothetical protein A2Y28_03145 [Chlamydiae bacterium GWC2_50_10]|nr:MAG: hypothetical protein A2Z85_01585 [Chlamydiae bacterium GWA2_50_15]OGN54257.1 MAG: hypothetical protein A2Y28_03145 [Chlamydiae bacterium GWC2_50_10]OGN54388.1 MAG: hypothetical protein A2098_02070 [Chlamydiae bacterium GWF2_49_8]OGN58779.1 MAG: hypothetical protein A3D18_06135 [Chlamydiae bacterium RIFCSPHIGHO2_02_FULL_49_29]OGN63245.1 MAG: hypothetical protein A3E26_04925 [Chlamydiae bacterium RIFCSPHIGHO2_12_FULL_49_32]OGN68387.1 MAG: hypothetical protein A3I15_04375 [Chlamydiae bact
MVKKATFSLSSQVDQVSDILRWIKGQVTANGLTAKEMKKIELAVEEVVVNVIEHTYQGKGGELEIVINDAKSDCLVFVFKDSGAPFDPLAYLEMLQKENSHERGGVGIRLVSRLMDRVHYQREDGFNILTLTKKIHSSKEN